MIISLLGWCGAGFYLLNHLWLALKKGHESRLYYAVNLVAALLIVVSSAALASWQPVLTNAFWVGVSAVALMRWPQQGGSGLLWLSERWLVAPIAAALVVGAVVAIGQPYTGFSVIGWAGTALFSVAYLTFATGRITRQRFLAYNAIAAFALVPILYLDANWPVFVLELVWGVTSAIGWRNARA